MIGEIGGNAEETAAAYIGKQREEAGGWLHRGSDGASGRRMVTRARYFRWLRRGCRQNQSHGSGGNYSLFLPRANRRNIQKRIKK